MALILCPECKTQVSDKSKICVNCGFSISKYMESLGNNAVKEEEVSENEMATSSKKENILDTSFEELKIKEASLVKEEERLSFKERSIESEAEKIRIQKEVLAKEKEETIAAAEKIKEDNNIILGLQEDIKREKANLEGEEKRIISEKTQLESDKKLLDNQIQLLEKDKKEFMDKNASLNEAINEFQKEKDVFENQKKVFLQEKGALESARNSLESEKECIVKEKEKLEKEKNEFVNKQSEYTELKKMEDKLEEYKGLLLDKEKECKTFSEQLSLQDKKQIEFEKRNKELLSDVEELTSKFEKIENSDNALLLKKIGHFKTGLFAMIPICVLLLATTIVFASNKRTYSIKNQYAKENDSISYEETIKTGSEVSAVSVQESMIPENLEEIYLLAGFEFNIDEYLGNQGKELSVIVTDENVLGLIDSVDGNRYLVGEKGGATAIVVCDANGNAKKIKVTVGKVTVDDIGRSIEVGEEYQLTYSDSYCFTDLSNIHWVSSDPSIVKVDDNGVVTGIREGIAYISIENISFNSRSVHVENLKEDVAAYDEEDKDNAVEVNKMGLYIDCRGYIEVFSDQGAGFNVNYDGRMEDLKYRITDETIASVTMASFGPCVQGKKKGVTELIISDPYGNECRAGVKVYEYKLAIDGSTRLSVGDKAKLIAEVYSPEGENVYIGWFTDDDGIISIDGEGNVVATGKGEINAGIEVDGLGKEWLHFSVK